LGEVHFHGLYARCNEKILAKMYEEGKKARCDKINKETWQGCLIRILHDLGLQRKGKGGTPSTRSRDPLPGKVRDSLLGFMTSFRGGGWARGA
jgi:hypothetical protein